MAMADAAGTGKAILLFSDGTGNSSGKLFKTNVWRAYEAADLGPPAPGRRRQIAFYDNGVGTSAFRPLALLGGIFGFGLKRNVLELYRFACRNYAPGDELYAFGFSRGAFTVRLAVALIASQGLVPADDEAALDRGAVDAWRAYRRRYLPRRWQWPTIAWRRLRDTVIRALRKPGEQYSLRRNRRVPIRFVGVWDTVAAYGGPIAEVTRAIDNWFYALSMPNYGLSRHVAVARHALALDDERDAFQPLVWDEVHEDRLIERGQVTRDRLRQIWFAGMHADVGGGYPDESLSYVSLLWMLEEARQAGLRTLDVITDRHRALANSSGPIHDSRAGIGRYYRYQPRRIAALLHPPAPETRLMWGPERSATRGLLTGARLHESVLARIVHGVDRYAPITIPATFTIDPQPPEETAPLPASGPDAMVTAAAPHPLLSPDERRLLLDPTRAAGRAAMMERVWDFVWWKRVAYFATAVVTAALLSMPLWPRPLGVEALCGDSRCILPGLFSPLKAVLPGAAAPWVDRYAAQPVAASVLLAVLAMLMAVGARQGAAIRARSAVAWRTVLGTAEAEVDRRGVARIIRRSPLYLSIMTFVKWQVLPALSGLALLTALLAVPGAIPTQLWLAHAERDGAMCRDPGRDRGIAIGTPVDMSLQSPCTDLRQAVTPRTRYVVTLDVTRQWCDGSLHADPAHGVTDSTWTIAPFGLHRRVTDSNWLKPLVIIRRPDAQDGKVRGAKVRIDPLDLRPVGRGRYEGSFTAPDHGGRLYLAVNDVAVPGWPSLLYANNHGATRVTVRAGPPESCTVDGCAATEEPPRQIACGAPIAPGTTEDR